MQQEVVQAIKQLCKRMWQPYNAVKALPQVFGIGALLLARSATPAGCPAVYWSSWIMLAAAIAGAAALAASHGLPWQSYVVGAVVTSLVESALAGLVVGYKSAPPMGQLLVAILVVAVAGFSVLFSSVVLVGLSTVVAGCAGVAQLTAAASRRLGVAMPLADAFAVRASRWLKEV